MNKNWVLTQDAFDTLLGWLDPDREAAGRKYEEIRRRLVTIFDCRGCAEPEDLADETINRVTSKLAVIQSTFVGDPIRYFFGVAQRVLHEYWRRKPPAEVAPHEPYDENVDKELACLERCMQTLTAANRKLIVDYYRSEEQSTIDHRKTLAERLGIAMNALRIRAHRIRSSLENCVMSCVQQQLGETC
jgi:DNA-directed RNA polymerase specialized sigma24 family protein